MLKSSLLLFAVTLSVLISQASLDIYQDILTKLKAYQQSSQVSHHFRTDFFLDSSTYPQDVEEPDSGAGRLHYIAKIQTSKMEEVQYYKGISYPVTVALESKDQKVQIKVESSTDMPLKYIDWLHCDINEKTGQIWISLHSSNKDFINGLQHITITDNAGNQVSSFDTPALQKDYTLKFSYITTMDNFSKAVVHIQNHDKSKKYQVSKVLINGVDIGEPAFQVNPKNSYLVTYSFPTPVAEGDVITAEFVTSDGVRIGNGVRVIKQLFVYQSWQHSFDCPFPETNSKNYQKATGDYDLNTLYMGKGYSCDEDPLNIIEKAASHGYHILAESKLDKSNPSKFLGKESGLAALSIGDEVDGTKSDTSVKWKLAMDTRERVPTIAQYQGGKTSRQCGLFAGITDIQGKDFYVAGCAPHITKATSTMRIQGSYDYLKNTRDNHMPLTTWGYSQFQHTWNTQPNYAQVNIQLSSVFASGMKGLMLFQIDMSQAGSDFNSKTKKVMKLFQYIRDDLRVADVEAVAFTKDDDKDQSIVSVLRAPGKLIVIAVNTKADGYNDILCYTGLSNHWHIHDHGISNIVINNPDGFQFQNNWKEVTKDGIVDMSNDHEINSSGQFVIKNTKLDSKFGTVVYLLE